LVREKDDLECDLGNGNEKVPAEIAEVVSLRDAGPPRQQRLRP
jgi:hypothetical protein